MPFLFVQSASGSFRRRIEFSCDLFKVGRKKDNDLILPDKSISGYHFQILRTEKGYEVEDRNSSNGTYLNKYIINDRTPLKEGDRIQASKYRMIFRLKSDEKGEKAASLKDSDIIDRKLEDMNQRLKTLKETSFGDTTVNTRTISRLESSIQEAKVAYSRLKALYRSTTIIVSHMDLEKRLEEMLKITMRVMNCDRGYIMLYEGSPPRLRIKVSYQIDEDVPAGAPSMSIAREVARTGNIKKIDNILDLDELKSQKSVVSHNIISAICSPITFEKNVIGVMYVDNITRTYHYTQEDVTIFEILANQTAVIIEDGRLFERFKNEERIRVNFERYFSPQIVSEIMSEKGMMEMGGVRKQVSVLFVDIRDFTSLAEESHPQVLIDSLNEYFKRMLDIIFKYDGCIDKFYGDGLLAFFGAPIEDENHGLKVYLTACDMREEMQNYCQYAADKGLLRFSVGIGICSGSAIVGNIGSQSHIEYTVIGDTVNVASRLSSEAKSNEILLADTTLQELERHGMERLTFHFHGHQTLRGRGKTIGIYSVK